MQRVRIFPTLQFAFLPVSNQNQSGRLQTVRVGQIQRTHMIVISTRQVRAGVQQHSDARQVVPDNEEVQGEVSFVIRHVRVRPGREKLLHHVQTVHTRKRSHVKGSSSVIVPHLGPFDVRLEHVLHRSYVTIEGGQVKGRTLVVWREHVGMELESRSLVCHRLVLCWKSEEKRSLKGFS